MSKVIKFPARKAQENGKFSANKLQLSEPWDLADAIDNGMIEAAFFGYDEWEMAALVNKRMNDYLAKKSRPVS